MRKADHLRVGNTDNGGYVIMCLHCGDIYVPALPCTIDMMLSISRQFGRDHNDCPKPEQLFDEAALRQKGAVKHLMNEG